MSELRRVVCDFCNRDLTFTGNTTEYRIVLRDEAIPSRGGAVTDMLMYPHIDGGPKHFCRWKCLWEWFVHTEASNSSDESRIRSGAKLATMKGHVRTDGLDLTPASRVGESPLDQKKPRLGDHEEMMPGGPASLP